MRFEILNGNSLRIQIYFSNLPRRATFQVQDAFPLKSMGITSSSSSKAIALLKDEVVRIKASKDYLATDRPFVGTMMTTARVKGYHVNLNVTHDFEVRCVWMPRSQ